MVNWCGPNRWDTCVLGANQVFGSDKYICSHNKKKCFVLFCIIDIIYHWKFLDLQLGCNLDLQYSCNLVLQLSYNLKFGGNVKMWWNSEGKGKEGGGPACFFLLLDYLPFKRKLLGMHFSCNGLTTQLQLGLEIQLQLGIATWMQLGHATWWKFKKNVMEHWRSEGEGRTSLVFFSSLGQNWVPTLWHYILWQTNKWMDIGTQKKNWNIARYFIPPLFSIHNISCSV